MQVIVINGNFFDCDQSIAITHVGGSNRLANHFIVAQEIDPAPRTAHSLRELAYLITSGNSADSRHALRVQANIDQIAAALGIRKAPKA